LKESAIVTRLLRMLRERGHWATKVHVSNFQQTGTPDILACVAGKFLALEVKADTSKKPTPMQVKNLEEISGAGGMAQVIWSVEQLELILRTMERR